VAAETHPEDGMSTRRLPARRKPGREPTHGARQALAKFRRSERLNYSRTHVKWRAIIAINLAVQLAGRQQWEAVEAALTNKSPPKVSRLKTALDVALAPLDAVQRERVLAAAEVGAAYKRIGAYVFQQRSFIDSDGELIPCMRKSFLGYGNAWRRELVSFDLEPKNVETPTLQQYLASRGSGIANAHNATQGSATDPVQHTVATDTAGASAAVLDDGDHHDEHQHG
jgi:hypothetical protein